MKRMILATTACILMAGCDTAPPPESDPKAAADEMHTPTESLSPQANLYNTWAYNSAYCDEKLQLDGMFTLVVDERGVRSSADDPYPEAGHWMSASEQDLERLKLAAANEAEACTIHDRDHELNDPIVYHTKYQRIALVRFGDGVLMSTPDDSYYLVDFEIDQLKQLPVID